LAAIAASMTVAIERFEVLEQLRALAHGYRIKVYFDQAQPPA
jgi:CMP-2-keto-3-deoxyoctulosonic acid synthetase